MPRPTGPQWVHLYRGISEFGPKDVDTSWIGQHWTTDRGVADSFATDGFDTGNQSGTVVEAFIHRRHIVDPYSGEGRTLQERSGVRSPEEDAAQQAPEHEKTVRQGAIVHVQKMHYVNRNSGELQSQEVPTSIRRVRA